MTTIITGPTDRATRVMLLGAGELGKEVVIELQRLGVQVAAADRYADAPGMHVADRRYVFQMLDASVLMDIVRGEMPSIIVPEIEAIATDALVELEKEGFTVIPTAKAAKLTMNREGIRLLAAQELGLKTSAYRFASTYEEYCDAMHNMQLPVVVKPIMSSSGKGQSVVRDKKEAENAWKYSQSGGRAGGGRVIVEEFVDFDYEITLLTVRHANGTSFLEPIGHRQVNGDYHESWQPQPMSEIAHNEAKRIALSITEALGGRGIFGVELFVKGDVVYFSEVSPRPHDTGMVTMISQDLSEFALHARALLGLPIPNIHLHGPSASAVILVEGYGKELEYSNLNEALSEPDTQIRIFGKPEVSGMRRMGVALARGKTIEEARQKALKVASAVKVRVAK